MSKEVMVPNTMESVILRGDLSQLTPDQRGQYVAAICEKMGLNPLTKPFEFMTMQGKLICYAGKNCAEQLRKIHNVSNKITSREKIDDVFMVTVECSLPNGRTDSAVGAVSVAGLKGDGLANAIMKAETKAKRRATLSICGLGMLDETEVETIPGGPPRVYPSQPEVGDGIFESDDPCAAYTIPGGQFVKRKLTEIGPKDLVTYIERGEVRIEKDPTKKPFWWDDFVTRAEGYLADLEQDAPNQE